MYGIEPFALIRVSTLSKRMRGYLQDGVLSPSFAGLPLMRDRVSIRAPIIQELIMMQFGKYLSALFLAFSLLTVAGCASTDKKAGTGEYVDDTVITAKVKAAIFNEPMLKVAEINVETFKGVVQLSGFVTSRAMAHKAIEVARGVSGVSSVKNDMLIK
ncbi:MAG: BON domain-containing protein [Azoarcus sp.]|nr:BON domain-containing protein [Azoarcus sp.]